MSMSGHQMVFFIDWKPYLGIFAELCIISL